MKKGSFADNFPERAKDWDYEKNGELLPTYPSVPWKNVKGLRDIIAHHYFDVDAAQILWIIKNEISPLKEAISLATDEERKDSSGLETMKTVSTSGFRFMFAVANANSDS